MKRYVAEQLDAIPPVQCPCGDARRAFAVPGNDTATCHLVTISRDSRVHYHKILTEIYIILEGQGDLELDGDIVPVAPLSAVMIKPGCRHRAVGALRILNIVTPPFDPDDEWED